MSFYVSTATFILLHCDEWDHVVALPRHKFVAGATLLQLAVYHQPPLYEVAQLKLHVSTSLSFAEIFCPLLTAIASPKIYQYLSPLMLRVRIPLRQGVLDTTLCDKVCQWFAAGRWFSPGTPVSATNKSNRHDITEILLKVALNTITLTRIYICFNLFFYHWLLHVSTLYRY